MAIIEENYLSVSLQPKEVAALLEAVEIWGMNFNSRLVDYGDGNEEVLSSLENAYGKLDRTLYDHQVAEEIITPENDEVEV